MLYSYNFERVETDFIKKCDILSEYNFEKFTKNLKESHHRY